MSPKQTKACRQKGENVPVYFVKRQDGEEPLHLLLSLASIALQPFPSGDVVVPTPAPRRSKWYKIIPRDEVTLSTTSYSDIDDDDLDVVSSSMNPTTMPFEPHAVTKHDTSDNLLQMSHQLALCPFPAPVPAPRRPKSQIVPTDRYGEWITNFSYHESKLQEKVQLLISRKHYFPDEAATICSVIVKLVMNN